MGSIKLAFIYFMPFNFLFYILNNMYRIQCQRKTDIWQALNHGSDEGFLVVSRFKVALRVRFDLPFCTEGCQDAEG